jgi:hypothetical protein
MKGLQMNRRSWLSGMLASLAGVFGFKTESPAQDKQAPFTKFKLKVSVYQKDMANPHDAFVMAHFNTLEDLFLRIDQVIKECDSRGRYVTFSPTGECIPHEDETILTIYRHEVLCPVSAGGKWEAWDEYNKKCRCCDKKVIAGKELCKEHLYLWRLFPKPWKERWYD